MFGTGPKSCRGFSHPQPASQHLRVCREFCCGFTPEITMADGGKYAVPWGRCALLTLKGKHDGGTGEAEAFWKYCESQVAKIYPDVGDDRCRVRPPTIPLMHNETVGQRMDACHLMALRHLRLPLSLNGFTQYIDPSATLRYCPTLICDIQCVLTFSTSHRNCHT